ncbi:MAG: LysM peptidoglycan-binding domain-containing protein [Brevefilum sp.]|nr:LysM peptidoglycan-binding domain-containing protein [Brevefilum sp.]
MENRPPQANPFEPNNGTRFVNCPYIGLLGDAVTFSDFPAQMNACHHVDPVSTPDLYHQRSFCLSPAFVDCPIYQNDHGIRMPKAIQFRSRTLAKKKKEFLIYIGLGVIVLTIIFGLLFISNWLPSASITDVPEETGISQTFSETAVTRTQELVKATLPQVTATPARTLVSATQEPPTPTHEPQNLVLDSPIGKEYQFIIHRVAEGETLQFFADQYNTSIEAITAVNYDLISPLWIDWMVIIPLNSIDVTNLPAFEAYLAQQQSIPLRELAPQLSVSLEDLAFYNNISTDYVITEGEWLLVPRERPAP